MRTFYPIHKKIYIGFTYINVQLLSRNELANKGFTVQFRPLTILHTEKFPTKTVAMKREEKQLNQPREGNGYRRSTERQPFSLWDYLRFDKCPLFPYPQKVPIGKLPISSRPLSHEELSDIKKTFEEIGGDGKRNTYHISKGRVFGTS